MSNYPPGVTGNEPQIAGPLGERTITEACDEEAYFVSVKVVSEMLNDFADRLTGLVEAPPGVLNEWMEKNSAFLSVHTVERECGWEGPVELTIHSKWSATWTCPRCGAERELDPTEYFYDPDEDRY